MQRLEAAPHGHMGKHITERHRRSSWSTEQAITCKQEGKITSLWTSAKLKPTLFRANTLHNRLFSEPLRKDVVSRHFHCSYSKANKISKSEDTRKVKYACYFWKCADAVDRKKYQNWCMLVEATACQSWRIFWHTVYIEGLIRILQQVFFSFIQYLSTADIDVFIRPFVIAPVCLPWQRR